MTTLSLLHIADGPLQMQDRHWIFVQKLADQLKCDVVVPIYTLAPLSTGTACVQTSIELLAHLQKDDVRYIGKQFVLMGDSAGGWIALRVLLALVARLKGKTTFRDREEVVEERELKLKHPEDVDYKAILDSVSDVLMISPVVDATADRAEDLEAEKRVRCGVRQLSSSLIPLYRTPGCHATSSTSAPVCGPTVPPTPIPTLTSTSPRSKPPCRSSRTRHTSRRSMIPVSHRSTGSIFCASTRGRRGYG